MQNKLTIILGFILSLSVQAFFIPSMPNLPMFGEFNPNVLRQDFNQFVGIKPDLERENRIISEIEESVMEGEVEYLTLPNKQEVFSIHLESELKTPKGGVIILHTRSQHANREEVIRPLRIGLAQRGWETLSVQMPMLDSHAKYYDYVPIFPYSHARIQAAITFYQQRGIDNIILIGHGCGAHMANSYFDKYSNGMIKAYIGIGLGATDYNQKVVNGFPFYKMRMPILDIYGEYDFPGVVRLAFHREDLIDIGGNSKSRQIMVDEAKHFYTNTNKTDLLIEHISTWLAGL
jgi:hypothetical protein